jgi:cell wall-associated NlpC family hydrolase
VPTLPRSRLLAFAFAAIVLTFPGSVPLALSSNVRRTVAEPVAFERPAATFGILARASEPKPKPGPTIGERAAAIAVREVGVPYRWGGASPASGFDCSGLVYWSYARLGVDLPHSSYALYGLGRSVPRSRMRPGDLLFFYGLGHVGIYIGRGRMVHAPHSGSRVQVVTLGSSSYGSRIVGVRRIS